MASKRRRSDSNDIQPRSDVLRHRAVSPSDDEEVEEVANVEYKSELERRNRPKIENGEIYDRRLKRGESRILVLHPGSESDKIKCELTPPSLVGGLKYEALSYTWGDQKNLSSILLGEVDFAVTRNLAKALWYLRDPHLKRSLWVDAICINQYDDKEKETQIESMYLIYERASKVFAWLGLPNDASNQVFFELEVSQKAGGKLVGQMVTKEIIMSEVKEVSDGEDDYWIDITSDHDNPFGELMARTYWTRAWIVQEIMFAKHLYIQCGPKVMRYEILEDYFGHDSSVSAEITEDDGEPGDIHFKGEAEVNIVRRDSQILSSKQYLDCFLDRQCEKQHDNIYAFLKLLGSAVKPRKSNYEIDISKLFLEIALEIIQSTQSLHIIIIKGRQRPPRAREEVWQRYMPSWCPYLATPYRCRPLKVENGPNLFAEKATFSVNKILQMKELSLIRKGLQVRGFVIGRVSQVISQRIPPKVRASTSWSRADIGRELAHYKRCVALGLKGVPKDCLSQFQSLQATTRTLLVAGRDEHPAILALSEIPTDNLERPDILAPSEITTNDLEIPDIHDLRRMFKNRISRSVCSFTLSRTANQALDSSEIAPSRHIHRIALVPRTASEEDEICLILGCSTPVVLRKIRKHHVVLGEAHIDTGLMGEFKVSVGLRDFMLGGNSFDRYEQFRSVKEILRGADPL